MKRVLSVVLSLAMLLSLACFVSAKEQPSAWAADEVNAAISSGLVPDAVQQNYTKGISRADLSKILSKLLDMVYGKAPNSSSAKFTDTTDSDVLNAANLGIINGYKQNNGTYMFNPNNTLKRCEMAAIVNRVAKLCGITTTGYDSLVTFADTAEHWCKGELGWPVYAGIVKGTSATTFSPESTLTTEQTIMMVYRLYTKLGENTTAGTIDPAAIDEMRIGSDEIIDFEWSKKNLETKMLYDIIPYYENGFPIDIMAVFEIPAEQYIQRVNALFAFPSDYFTVSLLERCFPEDQYSTVYHPSTNTVTVHFVGGVGGSSPYKNIAFSRYVDNGDGTVTFYYGRLKSVNYAEEVQPYLSDVEKMMAEDFMLWKVERDGETYVEAYDPIQRTTLWYGPELADESIAVTIAYSESNQYGRFVSYSDSLR